MMALIVIQWDFLPKTTVTVSWGFGDTCARSEVTLTHGNTLKFIGTTYFSPQLGLHVRSFDIFAAEKHAEWIYNVPQVLP